MENAIRRVQEKIRALRDQTEHNTKQKIKDESPLMAWMVRWAAEILSRYAPGEDGLIAFERIRREKCVVPLVMFGEVVLHLQLKTAKCPKGDPAKHIGIWLGP